MITKISIKKVASYGNNPAILATDKKINLVYGLNGTGKTTLSNFLAGGDDQKFSNCSIDGLSDEKILVYNQDFIEKNFYEVNAQKGIFTLSSENKEKEEEIKKTEKEIDELKNKLRNEEEGFGLEIDLENKKRAIVNLKEKSKEKIWEIKTKYSGGDRILEFCLDGKKGSQDLLFDHITKIKKPETEPKKTIENLKEEAEITQGENAKLYDESDVQKIDFDFSEIEEKDIFSEVIVGNESLQIANLIKQLNNDDWVKQGIDYIKKPVENDESEELENETCPFCQEKTISKKLYEYINDYFDESYKQKILEIQDLDSRYWFAWKEINKNESEILKNDFVSKRETEFKLLYKNFTDKLSSNWSKINNKLKKPSEVVQLESTAFEKDVLNNFFEEIVEEIRSHNLKINNKEKTKKEIVDCFWRIMRWNYDQTIENYVIQKEVLKKEKEDIEIKISSVNTQINDKKEAIKTAQKEIINIDEAINNINRELKFLGVEDFKVRKNDNNSYKLERSNEDDAQFKTLSEGEKTIISFLYFLELCKGKEKEDETMTDKIIIIDDPISSLSHIYVFNIAQLIKNTFFNDQYKQIFILTHSLYFFHEIIMKIKKNKKLFRITKNKDGQSCISEMKSSDIQNEYQSYWQVLKDHEDGMSHDSLLANSMRNILEYFFEFTDKSTLDDAIKQIEKKSEYQFFVRYIQRESHSDSKNITDMKDINPVIFKKAFAEIFKKAGYEKHYNKMIA